MTSCVPLLEHSQNERWICSLLLLGWATDPVQWHQSTDWRELRYADVAFTCFLQLYLNGRDLDFAPSMRMMIPLTVQTTSYGKSESMVHLRRPGLYHHSFSYGGSHDTWAGLLVLRPGPTKVGPEHDLGLHGQFFDHHLPMVLLGLFFGIFSTRHQRLHWRSEPFRSYQHSGRTESWLALDS